MVSSIMLKHILEHSKSHSCGCEHCHSPAVDAADSKARRATGCLRGSEAFLELGRGYQLEGILMLCFQKSRLRTQHITFLKMGAICI